MNPGILAFVLETWSGCIQAGWGSDLWLSAVVLWNSAPHVSTMLGSNLDLCLIWSLIFYKGKVVWPGSSRRRPTGDQDSLCWTGKDRKQAVWPGGSRQHPTGGKYSRSGWVSLAGRGVEEVRSPGRGARTGVRWEIKTHCQTGKDGKVKLGSREALAVTWLEMEARSLDGWDSPAAGLKRQVFWLGGSGQKWWSAVSGGGASPSVWFGQVSKSQESSHRVYETRVWWADLMWNWSVRM